MISVSAPCRVDLAGGTLDIWPLGVLHPGSVTVAAAVPVRVRLRIEATGSDGEVGHRIADGAWTILRPRDARRDLTAAVAYHLRPRGGLEIEVAEQAPVGSGLGGSSAFATALAGGILALDGREMPPAALVATLRDLEAVVLEAPTGTQDHWAAVCGGVLALHMDVGGDRVEKLDVEPGWLARRMTVFFTGITHSSGMVNWQVIRRRLEGDRETQEALEGVVAAARMCRTALLARDAGAVGEAIAAEWTARRRLAPEVCPPELTRLTDVALGAGAGAVKACGAGGGGSLLAWHEPDAGAAVAQALAEAAPAGRVLATGMDVEGLVVGERG